MAQHFIIFDKQEKRRFLVQRNLVTVRKTTKRLRTRTEMTKIKKGNDEVGKVQEKKETEADQSSRMIIMYEFVLSCIDEDLTIQTLYA